MITDLTFAQLDKYRDEMVGHTYKHFKGNIYTVVDVAIEANNEYVVVVYRSDDNRTWVRSLTDFVSNVWRNGECMKRFTLIN